MVRVYLSIFYLFWCSFLNIYIPIFSCVQCVGVIQLVCGFHSEEIPPCVLCAHGSRGVQELPMSRSWLIPSSQSFEFFFSVKNFYLCSNIYFSKFEIFSSILFYFIFY